MVPAGRMRVLAEHQRQEADTGADFKRPWKPTGLKAWLAVEQLSGSELLAAQQISAKATHRVRTHWAADVRTGDRWVAGERILQIASVDNVMEQNRELAMMCVERLEP